MAIPFPHPNSVAAGWLTPPKNRPWDSAASWCLGKSTFQAAKEWLSLGGTFDKKGNNLGYTGLGWGKRLQSKKSFSFDQLINLCCQLLALGANRWGRPAGWVLPYGLICCCLYRGSMNRTSYVVEVQTSYDCKTCWWFQRCSIVHPFWDDDPKRPGIVVVVVVVVVVVCYSYPHKLLLLRCRALCAYWSVYFSLFIYFKKNYE